MAFLPAPFMPRRRYHLRCPLFSPGQDPFGSQCFGHFVLDFPVLPKALALAPMMHIHLGWDLLAWGSRQVGSELSMIGGCSFSCRLRCCRICHGSTLHTYAGEPRGLWWYSPI